MPGQISVQLTGKQLVRNEWVDLSLEVRMKFRPDGTGYYEREATQDRKFVHENLLWRLEGDTLHLKFAHARFWTSAQAHLDSGISSEDGRYGEHHLTFERCPYTWAIEDRSTPEIQLQSDQGAPLP